MKDINLLPEEYLQLNEIKKLSKIIAALTAIIFLSIILIVAVLNLANSMVERKILNYEALCADTKYAESDETQKELLRREERSRSNAIVLSSIKRGTNIGAKDIVSVLGEIPDGVSALSVSADNDSQNIIFEGVTTDKSLIVEYVGRLNALGVFENVILSKISMIDSPNSLNEFSLELVLGGL